MPDGPAGDGPPPDGGTDATTDDDAIAGALDDGGSDALVGSDGSVAFDRPVLGIVPDGPPAEGLAGVVDAALRADDYAVCDWFDLPAPAYLVRDAGRDAAFRIVVRDGRIEVHGLPSTDAATIGALRQRIEGVTEVDWTVERADG
jgi:hypothetical protein